MRATIVNLVSCVLVAAIGCEQRDAPSNGAAAASSAQQLDGVKVDASLSAIQQYLQSNEIAKAEAIARTLVNRAPDEARSHEMLGQVLLSKAGTAQQEGDAAASADLKKHAWASYRRATQLDESNAGLLHSAGLVAMTAGEQAAALELFQRAEALDHTKVQYPLFAAQILLQQDRVDEAEPALRRALAISPDEPYVRASLAMVALARGDFDGAHKDIEAARIAEPENVGFRAQQAKIYRRQQRPREALELLIGLDDAARAQEAVTFEIAAAYDALGQPLKAAQAWAACAQAHPGAPSVHVAAVRAGELFLKGGDRENAARWAIVAERLAPDAPEVKSLRAQLDAAAGH